LGHVLKKHLARLRACPTLRTFLVLSIR